ncbi:hypothetical protein [Saccharibacillus alkalitolerans]|uniref:Uncharacterized protein n=1 Tax=Saccharibacillus alkalitolerans TaxID=2705290 RepID=A0ABX0F0N8_9BACL|nr:hypothetical protein [Saccharibacillus alkalitolerans]NGZ74105.1 hypothetical protein [Saccharibacillus alkalitolerans]
MKKMMAKLSLALVAFALIGSVNYGVTHASSSAQQSTVKVYSASTIPGQGEW